MTDLDWAQNLQKLPISFINLPLLYTGLLPLLINCVYTCQPKLLCVIIKLPLVVVELLNIVVKLSHRTPKLLRLVINFFFLLSL